MSDGDAAIDPQLAATVAEDAASSQPSRRDLPERVGRFAITRKLGEGGMGVVYAAYDAQLDRAVALKLVRAGEQKASARTRFLREAQAMARVAHPNVVPIYEVGLVDDDLFIAMELVEGETLTSWLAAEPRGWRQILVKVADAGRGLAAAHRAGVMHRDFKPDNVLVGKDGRVRVADFGLARGFETTVRDDEDDAPRVNGRGPAVLDIELTARGTLLGTPSYMSPEHFGGVLSPASDQWSLAVCMYRSLFKQRPFDGENPIELLDAILHRPPAPPPPSEVPKSVTQAILRALSLHPEDRFSSIAALLDVIDAELGIDPEHDPSVGRRRRRVASGIALALGLAQFARVAILTDFRFALTLESAFRYGLYGFTLMLAAVVIVRKAFLTNAYNRRVMSAFLLVSGVPVVHRWFALRHGTPVEDVVFADSLYAAAIFGFAALAVERALALAAAVFVALAMLSEVIPVLRTTSYVIAMFIAAAIALWVWRPAQADRATRASASRG